MLWVLALHCEEQGSLARCFTHISSLSTLQHSYGTDPVLIFCFIAKQMGAPRNEPLTAKKWQKRDSNAAVPDSKSTL